MKEAGMGMRMLAIRKGLDSLAERTRDRWGDLFRRQQTLSQQPGSLKDRLSFRLGLIKDWWATLQAEGGLWVKGGRPRVLTHVAAALLTASATAAVTWQIAAASAERSSDVAGAKQRQPSRIDTPRPIHAAPIPAPIRPR
jgi:hypothetical protein